MSGIACAVDNGETVQLVTGHDPADSWDEYGSDPLFAATADTLFLVRGDPLVFLFAATEHVYELPRELVGLVD